MKSQVCRFIVMLPLRGHLHTARKIQCIHYSRSVILNFHNSVDDDKITFRGFASIIYILLMPCLGLLMVNLDQFVKDTELFCLLFCDGFQIITEVWLPYFTYLWWPVIPCMELLMVDLDLFAKVTECFVLLYPFVCPLGNPLAQCFT